MTPYEYAKALAADIAARTDDTGRSVPKQVLPQLGDIIIDCEGSWVSVTGLSQQELVSGSPVCGVVDMADVQVASAFECAITSDEDGLTDPVALAEVSEKQGWIGEILVEWARGKVAESVLDGSFGGVQFQNNGGLGVVVVSFTAAVP